MLPLRDRREPDGCDRSLLPLAAAARTANPRRVWRTASAGGAGHRGGHAGIAPNLISARRRRIGSAFVPLAPCHARHRTCYDRPGVHRSI